ATLSVRMNWNIFFEVLTIGLTVVGAVAAYMQLKYPLPQARLAAAYRISIVFSIVAAFVAALPRTSPSVPRDPQRPPPLIRSFRLASGPDAAGKMVLAWEVDYADSVWIEPGPGAVGSTGQHALQAVLPFTSVLTATGRGGSASYSLIIGA